MIRTDLSSDYSPNGLQQSIPIETGRPSVDSPADQVSWRRVLALGLILFLSASLSSPAASRTLEFETAEATLPVITLAPDGQSMVFSMLGHLFQLKVGGGNATQLTRGSSYNTDPAFSPDGSRLAFISDRDGSDGNLFVLELAGGKVSQLTHEFRAGSPAWSPDGKTIAYLRYQRREEYPLDAMPGIGGGPPGTTAIRTIPSAGGAATDISAPQLFGSLFFLADGRLAWTVNTSFQGRETRIESRTSQGGVALLASLQGAATGVAPSPKGDGIFYLSAGTLRFLSFSNGTPQEIGRLAANPGQLAASQDGKSLYAAADGKLWRVSLPSGTTEPLVWRAHVTMDVLEREIPKWTAPASAPAQPRQILTPRLSPDGQRLVFMAAGALWEQPLSGGQAKRLLDEAAFQCDPAFSPDGRQLAFIADVYGERQVRVYDFASRQSRTLYSVGGASWPLFPHWSNDGKRLLFQRTDAIRDPYRFISVSVADGKTEALGQSGGSWNARPHFSRDGTSLYFTGRLAEVADLYRLSLREGAKPEPLTQLTRHVHDGLISPDEKWVAFRRNTEIWLAPAGSQPLRDEDFRRISEEGGRSFAFTSDSSAIVYSSGTNVWRQPLQGGQRVVFPIHLSLPRPVSEPLLVRNVRPLDLRAGRFSEQASILIENGRISWIGPEDGRRIPSNAAIVEAAGRYAIPGMFDYHVHSAWANQQATEDAFIAYGVTSVRDTGSRIDLMGALQDRGDSTDLPVPRYFYSGDIFEGLMPLWGDAFLEITTPDEARSYVQHWKAQGVHFIKVYASLPWFLKRVVAEEAHRAGLPIAGHGLSVEEIVRSVTLGFSTLEHTSGASNDDIIKLLAASGTEWDPTLTVGERTALDVREDPDRLTNPKIRTFVPSANLAAAKGGGMYGRQSSDALRASWKAKLARILSAYNGGVKLMDGTDALMTGIFFGPSLHWELEYLAEAGLPSIEVLRLATQGAAEAVGAGGDLGTIEPGKFADLVLLDANPIEDIRNTLRIWRVVKSGRIYDPAALRPSVASPPHD